MMPIPAQLGLDDDDDWDEETPAPLTPRQRWVDRGASLLIVLVVGGFFLWLVSRI